METDKVPGPSVSEPEADEGPIRLLQTLGWAFLPPAFASAIYGILDVFAGMESGTAIFAATVFSLVLIFSPKSRLLDWIGLCFTTAAVGLFAVGNPATWVLGGVATLFAVLTIFDEGVPGWWKRFLLSGIYTLTAGLAAVVFLVPVWATLGLALLYMFCYLIVRLMPIGLLARASLMDDDS